LVVTLVLLVLVILHDSDPWSIEENLFTLVNGLPDQRSKQRDSSTGPGSPILVPLASPRSARSRLRRRVRRSRSGG
jgi:hypothetical protein